jgi:hypothetical protein
MLSSGVQSFCALLAVVGGSRVPEDTHLLQHIQTHDTADKRTICQLPYSIPAGVTATQVKAKLAQDCLLHYDGGLCSRVLDQLFVDIDMDAGLDERECDQIVGLVEEHWRHRALSLRAAHPHDDPTFETALLETSVQDKPKGDWGPWRPLGTWYQGMRPFGPWVPLADADLHEYAPCWLPYNAVQVGSTTYGDVRKLLRDSCHTYYGEELCASILHALFEDLDMSAVYEGSQCPQFEGLIQEHYHHQKALAAHASTGSTLLEDSSTVLTKRSVTRHLESSMGSKHNCPPGQC